MLAAFCVQVGCIVVSAADGFDGLLLEFNTHEEPLNEASPCQLQLITLNGTQMVGTESPVGWNTKYI